MRLPRNVSGDDLATALRAVGYGITRQTGSHHASDDAASRRASRQIPRHSPLRMGTLSAILQEVAEHLSMTKDSLIGLLKLAN